MTDELLSIMKFDTPRCPQCNRIDKQLKAELWEKQETTCGYCGDIIPLSDGKWIEKFKEMVAEIRAQYRKN